MSERKPSRPVVPLSELLFSQWHHSKNLPLLPENVSAGSGKKIWWVDALGHEWESTPLSRKQNQSTVCAACSGSAVLAGFNDITTVDPALARELHPTKNPGLDVLALSAHSKKKVWWLGLCGHEWESNTINRSQGNGCPYCANKAVLVGFNDLEYVEVNT